MIVIWKWEGCCGSIVREIYYNVEFLPFIPLTKQCLYLLWPAIPTGLSNHPSPKPLASSILSLFALSSNNSMRILIGIDKSISHPNQFLTFLRLLVHSMHSHLGLRTSMMSSTANATKLWYLAWSKVRLLINSWSIVKMKVKKEIQWHRWEMNKIVKEKWNRENCIQQAGSHSYNL